MEELGTQVYIFTPDGGSPVFDDITSGIGPGFDDALNKYAWSAEAFDGDGDGELELYVGTLNSQLDPLTAIGTLLRATALLETGAADLGENFGDFLQGGYPPVLDTDGGQIWRYDFEAATWSQVAGPEVEGIDDGDSGFREMAVFNGQIYASTSNGWAYNIVSASENPAKIIVSGNGTSWTTLEGGPLDAAEGNSSIRSMDVVTAANGDEVLIVGTENVNGAQVWTLDAAGNWAKLATLDSLVHSETAVFGGEIYLGGWLPYSLSKLELASADTATLVDVTPQNVALGDQGVMQLVEFEGAFYVGSLDFGDGASLFRSETPDDPTSWEVITTDGFQTDGAGNELLDDELRDLGIGEITYVWQTAVVDGTFYIGDFNGVQGLLLASDDGEDWEIVSGEEGFGGAYGLRSLVPLGLDEGGIPRAEIAPNTLAIGTADTFYEILPLEDQTISGDFITGIGPEPLTGTALEDIIIGGAGSSAINAGAEDDIVVGDFGDGLLFGGNDLINGEAGDDTLLGALGDDTVSGGDGADVVFGGLGRDDLSGDAGIDILLGDLAYGDRTIDVLQLFFPQIPDFEIDDIADAIIEFLESLPSIVPGISDAILPLPLPGPLPVTQTELVTVEADLASPVVRAEMSDFLGPVLPAADTVFEGVFGVDVADTLDRLASWFRTRQNVSDTEFERFFAGTVELDAQEERDLFDLFTRLDTPISTLTETDLAAVFNALADTIRAIEGGQLPVLDPAFEELIGLFTDPPEEILDLPIFDLSPEGLLDLAIEIIEEIASVAGAFDEAAEAAFGEGFLQALLTETGLFEDTLRGGDGDDLAFGGPGSDSALGGDGNDVLFGDGGRDTLLGEAGDDILYGDGNDDRLVGGPGSDTMVGGDGTADTAAFDAPIEAARIREVDDGVEVRLGAEAEDDEVEVSADSSAIVIDVLANDTPPEVDVVWSDVEFLEFDGQSFTPGQALSAARDDGEDLVITSVDTTGTLGLVEINPDGTISYDAAGAFEMLAEGQTATDSFRYTINGGTDAEMATVIITVNGVDEEPGDGTPPIPPVEVVAIDDTATIIEDEGPLSIPVLENDITIGADGLRILGFLGDLEFGSISIDGSEALYTPNAELQKLGEGETRTEVIDYIVTNNAGLSDIATITIEVIGRNDVPVAIGSARRTDADTPFFFVPLLADADGDAVEIVSADGNELEGTATVVFNDTILYDPTGAFPDLPEGETTTETIEFLVADGNGGRSVASTRVVVTGTGPAIEELAGDALDNSFEVASLDVPRSVVGGDGSDEVSLPGTLGDYAFEPIVGGHRAVPLAGGQVQDLIGVEIISFGDGALAVVDDPDLGKIELLYELTYDRPADLGGLTAWYAAHEGGLPLEAIADAFALAPEFEAFYGADASNEEVVTRLYERGLDRAGDTAGIEFWTGQLDSGEFDRGDMLLSFACSDEMADRFANELDDGLLLLA